VPARGSGYPTRPWKRCPVCDTNEWRQRKNGRKVCVYCDREGAKRRRRKTRSDLAARLWEHAKRRADEGMVNFLITVADVQAVWPADGRCPVYGVPLEPGVGFAHDRSPTLDRINPEWGYEIGNIAVISMKANRAKGGLSADDLEAIVQWMRQAGLR
jgi:hypothetical protein